MLARQPFAAIEIQHGAIQRAAVGLDAAHDHEAVGVGRGLGHQRNLFTVQPDRLAVVAGERVAAFGFAHAYGRAKGIALGIAAQERLGEHKHPGALLGRLADQGSRLLGAGDAVGGDGGRLDDGSLEALLRGHVSPFFQCAASSSMARARVLGRNRLPMTPTTAVTTTGYIRPPKMFPLAWAR